MPTHLRHFASSTFSRPPGFCLLGWPSQLGFAALELRGMALPVLVHVSMVPRVAQVWEQLSANSQRGLERCDLTSVSVFRACMAEGTAEEARATMVEAGGDDSDTPLLQEMWVLAAAGAASEVRRVANVPVVRVSVHAALSAKKRKSTHGPAGGDRLHTDHASSHLRPSALGFPTLRRSRALEGDPKAREKAENAKRQHWINELRSIVLTSDMPIVQIARTHHDPSVILSGIGQGRRAATIRRRVLDWKRAGRFFLHAPRHCMAKGPTRYAGLSELPRVFGRRPLGLRTSGPSFDLL